MTRLLPLTLLLSAALLSACDNMAKQPSDKTWRPANANPANTNPGSRSWPPEPTPNTVALEDRPQPPPPLTPALLARGKERYEIYCTPCHGYLGDGDGMIVQRGFPHPPSFHSEALRNAPTRHFYDVATNGWGAMYAYADRVTPDDRWAIAAYIRALQTSQNTAAAELPGDVRGTLR